MRIEKLHIVNMFQYTDRNFEFFPGINFIIGPNGSGKTNLLHSIMYALDGQLPFRKNDCIRYNSIGDAFVELDFVVNNVKYTVTRNVTKTTAHLQSSEMQVDGIQEVNEAISRILGISAGYRRNHIFLAQGGVGSFLNCTPAERAERVWDSMQLERIGNVWQKLGELLAELRKKCSADYTDELNELERLKNQRKTLKYRFDLEILKRERELYKKLDMYKEQLSEEQAKKQKLTLTLDRLTKELSELTGVNFTPDEELDALLVNYNHYLTYCNNFNRAITLFRQRPHFHSEKQVTDEELQLLRAEIDQFRGRLHFLEQARKLGSDGYCLLCESRVDTQIFLSRLDKRLEEYKQVLRESELTAQEYDRLIKEKKRVIEARTNIREFIRQLRLTRRMLGDVRKYDKATLAAYRAAKLEYESQLPKFNRLKLEIASVNGQITNATATIAQLEANIAAIERVLMLERDEIEEEISRIEAIHKINERIEILETFKVKHEKQKVLQERLAILEQVRGVFSRNSLISLCIDRYVEYISRALMNLLTKAQANFSAILSKNFDKKGNLLLQFDIFYKDGKQITEDQLSYGERLILSLAYHLAVNSISNVNMLLLDEPTLGLDEIRISSLPGILYSFISSHNQKLQLICSTHDRNLMAPYNVPVINLWETA